MKSFGYFIKAGKQLLSISLPVIFVCFTFNSCKKDLNPGSENQQQEALKKDPKGDVARVTVHNGGSIQSAVNSITGGIILVEPGIYKEAIEINKPGIQLIGSEEGVIIENPGDEENGITVNDQGDGFVLKNVTVRGFEENGVYLTHVDGFLLSHVTAIDNGEYGLFPVFCAHGIIEHCSASGHSDTGIYVGQSTDVSMSFNKVNANVNGLEIENSSRVQASHNQCYDNVSGISIVLLPGLTVKTSSDIEVTKNIVSNNNHVNFSEPGGFEYFVPTGVGIFILGTDNTIVNDNVISDNNFVGIANVSVLVLAALANLPPSAFGDIEPNPDNNKIVGNKLIHNGTSAPAGFPLPAVDLLWDGSGNNNCWRKNIYSTSYPVSLPVCPE
jgi:parallel beta-helix repeat protein